MGKTHSRPVDQLHQRRSRSVSPFLRVPGQRDNGSEFQRNKRFFRAMSPTSPKLRCYQKRYSSPQSRFSNPQHKLHLKPAMSLSNLKSSPQKIHNRSSSRSRSMKSMKNSIDQCILKMEQPWCNSRSSKCQKCPSWTEGLECFVWSQIGETKSTMKRSFKKSKYFDNHWGKSTYWHHVFHRVGLVSLLLDGESIGWLHHL